MFEGFGPEKLMMVLLIVLVLFGGKRIPEIGASLGKGIREFKKGIHDIGDSVNEPGLPIQPVASPVSIATPAAAGSYAETRAEPKRLISQ